MDEVRALHVAMQELDANQDFVRQGDRPKISALVTEGVVARYHLLPDGGRQYLSYHLTGDMPDSQSLFVDQMDHAVCAVGPAKIVSIPHSSLLAAFERRPSLAYAIWRETLIDAAIFREAITNNSARSPQDRMAHFFCEFYYRSRASGLTRGKACYAPMTLGQLGETLGISLATVNRVLSELRQIGDIDFKNNHIIIHNWGKIVDVAKFDPRYLHLRRAPL